MTARVQADGFARPAQVGKALVDEQFAVVVVEGIGAAHEMADLLNPGRMVDQLLEGFAGLVNLLQVEPVRRTELMGVDIPVPLADLHRRNRVEAGIDLLQILLGDRVLDV